MPKRLCVSDSAITKKQGRLVAPQTFPFSLLSSENPWRGAELNQGGRRGDGVLLCRSGRVLWEGVARSWAPQTAGPQQRPDLSPHAPHNCTRRCPTWAWISFISACVLGKLPFPFYLIYKFTQQNQFASLPKPVNKFCLFFSFVYSWTPLWSSANKLSATSTSKLLISVEEWQMEDISPVSFLATLQSGKSECTKCVIILH